MSSGCVVSIASVVDVQIRTSSSSTFEALELRYTQAQVYDIEDIFDNPQPIRVYVPQAPLELNLFKAQCSLS